MKFKIPPSPYPTQPWPGDTGLEGVSRIGEETTPSSAGGVG